MVSLIGSLNANIFDANKVECNFPIKEDGKQSIGNFFPCRENGCNEKAYLYFNKPNSYTEIKDFVVDFKEKKINYKWVSKNTKRRILEDNSKPLYYFNDKLINSDVLDFDRVNKFIALHKIKTAKIRNKKGRVINYLYSDNVKKLDHLIADSFYHVNEKIRKIKKESQSNAKEVKRYIFFNLELKDRKEIYNTLTFYNNNKIAWKQESTTNFESGDDSYHHSISFGKCKIKL